MGKPESELGNSQEQLLSWAKNLATLENGGLAPLKFLPREELAQAEVVLDTLEDENDRQLLENFIDKSKENDAKVLDRVLTEVQSQAGKLGTENFSALSEETCKKLEDRLVDMNPDVWETVSDVIAESRRQNEKAEKSAEMKKLQKEVRTREFNRGMEFVHAILLRAEGNVGEFLPDNEISKVPDLTEEQRSEMLLQAQELEIHLSPDQKYYLENGTVPPKKEKSPPREKARREFFDRDQVLAAAARNRDRSQQIAHTEIYPNLAAAKPTEPQGWRAALKKVGDFLAS